MKTAKKNDNALMLWEINLPALKNPLLWIQLAITAFASTAFLALLLLALNLYEDQWERIPESLMIGFFVGSGIFIAFALITVLLFWRGVPTRYVLQPDHIEQHTLSKLSRIANRLGPLAILTGSSAGFSAAGASLLARSREVVAINWQDVTAIKTSPKRQEIKLYNDWRPIMQIICPSEQYEQILQKVQQKTEKSTTTFRAKAQETPLAIILILSLVTLICGFFLFPDLPVRYLPIFTIGNVILAFLTLWSSGNKQRIFGALLLVLTICGLVLALINGETALYREGANYALIIEVIALGFFGWLGLTRATRNRKV